MTDVETQKLITERFARTLLGAPFNTKDADLVPEAGACDKCPFRTGNLLAKEDLADSGGRGGKGGQTGVSPSLCTKPACFQQKCAAAKETIIAKAREEGCEVMEDDDAAEQFAADTGELRSNSDYVAVDAKPDPALCAHFNEKKLRTWGQMLADEKVKIPMWLAKRPGTQEFVKLAKWEAAVKAITEAQKARDAKTTFKVAEANSEGGKAGEEAGRQDVSAAEEHERKLVALRRLVGALEVAVGNEGGMLCLVRLLREEVIEQAASGAMLMLVKCLGGDPDETTIDEALEVSNTLPSQVRAMFTMLFASWLDSQGVDWDKWKPWTDILKVDLTAPDKAAEKAAKAPRKPAMTSRSGSVRRNTKVVSQDERAAGKAAKKPTTPAKPPKAAKKKPAGKAAKKKAKR